ncbi:COG5403 Uncharacterized conserved protein [Caulobacteraceae bacterium]
MDLMDILRQTGGVNAIANQLGISPETAEAGANSLLPAIIGGFTKHSDANGGGDTGLGSLVGMLQGLGGGALATNVIGPEPTNVENGNTILGQIFGSKDVSRTVAGHSAAQTGIDPKLLKQMLPILSMLVGGYLSQQASSGAITKDATIAQNNSEGGLGGMLGSILGSVLGGAQSSHANSSGGMGSLGGLASMLDMNKDGNPLDDIISIAGKLAR